MKKLLLVEGEGDREFFSQLINKMGLNSSNIDLYPPKQQGARSNGIGNLVNIIPIMVATLKAGGHDRAGIIIDADYAGINGGFSQQKSKIALELSKVGYFPTTVPMLPIGEQFVSHGLPDIFLYILPDHSNNGMLEDVLLSAITNATQQTLLSHAKITVNGLPIKLFNQTLHTGKAELNTFLSWQNKPPASMGRLVDEDIIDLNAGHFPQLTQWTKFVCQ